MNRSITKIRINIYTYSIFLCVDNLTLSCDNNRLFETKKVIPMILSKYELARAGDKITFELLVEIKPGYNFQKGTIYHGHVIKRYESATDVVIVGDDGTLVETIVDHKYGAEKIEILLSDEEFEKRKEEWLENAIEQAKINAEAAFTKQVEYLKSIEFR